MKMANKCRSPCDQVGFVGFVLIIQCPRREPLSVFEIWFGNFDRKALAHIGLKSILTLSVNSRKLLVCPGNSAGGIVLTLSVPCYQ